MCDCKYFVLGNVVVDYCVDVVVKFVFVWLFWNIEIIWFVCVYCGFCCS